MTQELVQSQIYFKNNIASELDTLMINLVNPCEFIPMTTILEININSGYLSNQFD